MSIESEKLPFEAAERPKILIIGAGFAGVAAAKALRRAEAQVTLVDRNNFHCFFPLLYQVGAAELEPSGIAYPVRGILRRAKNSEFVLGEVTAIDLAAQKVSTDDLTLNYDYLILALGSVTNYFGVKGAKEFSFPLRHMGDGIRLRDHILNCFERASHEKNAKIREKLLTFVIVGGGPTGVEFAGALSELFYKALKRDYPKIDFSEVSIHLLEATEYLVSGFPEALQIYTENRLLHKHINVHTQSVVTEVKKDSCVLKKGDPIFSSTIVWTAGVMGDECVKEWGLPTTKANRIPVLPTLQLEKYPQVMVVGDLAYLEEKEGETAVPMVAPAAKQQGRHAAKNILRLLKNKKAKDFKYLDKGMMATIGRNSGIANFWGKYPLEGFPAWIAWLLVHITYLIGFRNRLLVLLNWGWSYFTFDKMIRLILHSKKDSSK